MSRVLRFPLVVAATVVLAGAVVTGCSSNASGSPVSCSPSGSALTLTAPKTSFDKNCLAAPAGQAFTVQFTNQDSTGHNFLISTAFAPGSPILFQGDVVAGQASTTYDVPALAPGRYSFECSLHPGFMHGTFIVAAPVSATSSASST